MADDKQPVPPARDNETRGGSARTTATTRETTTETTSGESGEDRVETVKSKVEETRQARERRVDDARTRTEETRQKAIDEGRTDAIVVQGATDNREALEDELSVGSAVDEAGVMHGSPTRVLGDTRQPDSLDEDAEDDAGNGQPYAGVSPDFQRGAPTNDVAPKAV